MNIGDVITTAEELDALPSGSLITAHDEFDGPWRKVGSEWDNLATDGSGGLDMALVVAQYSPVLLTIPGRLPRPERVVKAEALREASDAWQTHYWADDFPAAGASRPALILGMAQRATDFLRRRADWIKAGDLT